MDLLAKRLTVLFTPLPRVAPQFDVPEFFRHFYLLK
jgi:hypothetical protein